MNEWIVFISANQATERVALSVLQNYASDQMGFEEKDFAYFFLIKIHVMLQ